MKQGFAALITVLILSAFVILITTSAARLAVREAASSLSQAKGQEILKIAESCVEESLIRLRNSSSYSGGTLTFAAGFCVSAVSGTGANRTIDATGMVTGPPAYSRSLQIQVKVVGKMINVLNWNEI